MLRASQLHKSYGDWTAGAGVSLSLAPRDILGLLEANFAAKPIAVGIVAGLITATKGSALFTACPAISSVGAPLRRLRWWA